MHDNNEDELFNSTFEKYRYCSNLLIKSPHEGREILISILENRNEYDKTLDFMLGDLVEAAGFYPYLKKESFSLISTQQVMRSKYYESSNLDGIVFHEEQKFYMELIKSGRNLILSAPTSFGKSLLIEEIISSYKFKNILIIQPTLALLDETRKNIKKYKANYNMIVRTSQKFSKNKGNVFLLTAERVTEYQELPIIDFLIVDEFYKVSSTRDDERHQSLNNALMKIFNLNPIQRFYFLGPNIDGVSKRFLDKYNAIFDKTTYGLVKCNVHNVYYEHANSFGDRGKKAEFKEKVLFDLLWSKRDEQTIIYCSSPARARRISKNFTDFIKDKIGDIELKNIPLIEWIEKNVSNHWSLIESLSHGIAFHDGSLPRHMTSSLVDYFNESLISFIFCTSTIIEGVNSNAKNIVYFDSKKGGNDIDFFDYSNIKGRAGRLMQHYTGNVYNFNPPPLEENIFIDIPFIDQAPVSAEILINISEDDVINKENTEYKFINSLTMPEKMLFSKNQINIRGQKALLDYLLSNLDSIYDELHWTLTPKYSQLKFCLMLCWDYLLSEEEKDKSNLSYNRMTKLTYDYASSQSINSIIRSIYEYSLSKIKNKTSARIQRALDDAIRDGFHFLRQWFQYKLPKLLLVLNEVQTYVCALKNVSPGNYSYYCSLIENDFLDEQFAMLIEYGIPKSAIDSLRPYIKSLNSEEEIIGKITKDRLYESTNLLEYERDLLRKNIL